MLAHHGHPDDPDKARAALRAGLLALAIEDPTDEAIAAALERTADEAVWAEGLDRALEALDALRPADKQTLVTAMLATITHGGQTVVAEVELLRAIAASLHVPLPVAEMPAADAE